TDILHQVVLDPDVLVALAVDEDLLLTLLVFKAELVEAAAAFGAVRFDGAFGLLIRQRVGRHLIGVVDSARDNGAVRIAFEEVDNHFLSDARNPHGAPVLSRPELRHANPAGAVLVGLTAPVPEDLDLHTAV